MGLSDRWAGLEGPKWLQSYVWSFGEDVWTAELSCACWLESLPMSSPSRLSWGNQIFYMVAGAPKRAGHDLLTPSLESHMSSPPSWYTDRSSHKSAHIQGERIRTPISQWKVSQRISSHFLNCHSCLQFSHIIHKLSSWPQWKELDKHYSYSQLSGFLSVSWRLGEAAQVYKNQMVPFRPWSAIWPH